MQSKINVVYTDEIDESKIINLLDSIEKKHVDCLLWKQLSQDPVVAFSIIYNKQFVFLKYFVTEAEKRAIVQQTNGAVWEDNCVEFFISLDEGKSYFNFEFNCIGTRLAGYGTSKTERKLLPLETVENITTLAKTIEEKPGFFNWELFIAIPISTFQQPSGFFLQGKRCLANFYKCGDALPEPHFLSWSVVKSPEPDFHLPQYFGEIFFQ